MSRTQTLQPVIFEVRPELLDTILDFYVIRFPEAWKAPILELEAARHKRPDKQVTIPIRTLNGALEALLPLMAQPNAVKVQERGAPWLLAESEIPARHIHLGVLAWLELTYGNAASTVKLDASNLVWQHVSRPVCDAPAPNGTAMVFSDAYRALPATLADQLVMSNATVMVGGQVCKLVRVPCQDGAMLVSWPPTKIIDKNVTWAYSYFINLTVQTVPGVPTPRIHAHYGVRRWVTRPLRQADKLYLRTGNTSVYMRLSEPWLGSRSGAFTRARLTTRERRSEVVYADLTQDIAGRLDIAVPDAEALAKDPLAYLNGVNGVQVGIIDRNTRYHPISAGLGLEEHEQLTRVIQAKLSEQLKLVPPLQRPISLPTKKTGRTHPLIEDLLKIAPTDRQNGFIQSIAKEVTIELWYTSPATRDMLANRLRAMLTATAEEDGLVEEESEGEDNLETPTQLGLLGSSFAVDMPGSKGQPTSKKKNPERKPETVEGSFEIPLATGGRILVVPRPLTALLRDPLPAPTDKEPKSAPGRASYRRSQAENRANAIVKELGQVSEPTLAIVEMPNYNSREHRQQFGLRDPKRGVRLGLAWSGRLSKFTTGEAKDLENRCEGAVLDGLRQMGYVPSVLGFDPQNTPGTPEPLLLVAVWCVRLTQKRALLKTTVPVVVMLHTGRHEVRAWLPDGKGVRPYREAQLDLTRFAPEALKRAAVEEGLKTLRRFLLHDLPREHAKGDIVVFAVAQNARATWKGLQNGAIEFDAFSWDTEKPVTPLQQIPAKMRLIRLRTADRGETPEWYVKGAEPGKNYTEGIWDDPASERLFWDIATKPHTQAFKRKGKQVDPGEHYAVPTMLEVLMVALQQGDDPAVWALAVDRWRRMSFTTNVMGLLPPPLPWAVKMDKYAAVAGLRTFEEGWGEEEDEDDEEQGPVQLSLFNGMDL